MSNVNDAATPETTISDKDPPAEDHSVSKSQKAIQSLSSILHTIPLTSLSSSQDPCLSLLHDHQVSTHVSSLLRHPTSGAGDNNLCRWLYDAFQSGDPGLQLVVLSFVPVIAGVYLSRATLRRPLAGFEAILLAIYAHETISRAGQPITVNVPDMSHPSIYHESMTPAKNNATVLNLTVVSPSLEPHGTVRSTRRARIVGVALELYYSKISGMPASSKVDFCEFCRAWAEGEGDVSTGDESGGPRQLGQLGRRSCIPLPWELLQPIIRILGHCVVVPPWKDKDKDKEVFEAARAACRSLHGRATHDINPKAILATESLLRLGNMSFQATTSNDDDHQNLYYNKTDQENDNDNTQAPQPV